MSLVTGLLPLSSVDFIVLADTHYLMDGAEHAAEFQSRRKQNARIATALRLFDVDEVAFAVHLGDHVQDYPGNPTFEQSMSGALAQLGSCAVPMYHVAGNTDVGDKADPVSPGVSVSSAAVDTYHSVVGESWYEASVSGLHLIVINTSLLNSGLDEEATQRQWLEDVLGQSPRGRRRVVFMHYPLFLRAPHDPHIGHYDVVGQPARSWLLGLLGQHGVEHVFSGHSHFAFLNRVGGMRLQVVPSTSFTRPGFSELFSSAPPPEHGRDDQAKLGMCLVRVHEDGLRTHLVRTQLEDPSTGQAPPLGGPLGGGLLVTAVPSDAPTSRLGVVLRHPLATVGDVPVAFPSAVRQPVRNDYPLLACLELGLGAVHLPGADLDDPTLAERVGLLRDEGVRVTASWIWRDADLPDAVARVDGQIDAVQLQVPGKLLPTKDCLAAVERMRATGTTAVGLARLAADDNATGGRELPRIRCGYRLDELDQLADALDSNGAAVDHVTCLAPSGRPETWISVLSELPSCLGTVDVTIDLAAVADGWGMAGVSEAILATAVSPRVRLFLDPLMALDRTLDPGDGLLDRLCNPRPIFHAARCMNTVVYARSPRWSALDRVDHAELRLWRLTGPDRTAAVASLDPSMLQPGLLDVKRDTGLADSVIVDLATGALRQLDTANTVWVSHGRPVLVVQDQRPVGP